MKKALALVLAATFVGGAAFAAPGKKTAKPAPKKTVTLTEIKTCPVTGEEVTSDSGGSSVVGKYKVHFCCAGCKPSFDKMAQADKEKKLAELAKKSGKKG
jgi:hypothetical protein